MKHVSRRRICTASIAAFVLTGLASVEAQTTWSNSGGDNLWNTPANWSLGAAPDAASDVLFPVATPSGTGSITLGSGSLANSLAFNNIYSLTGGNLTLTSGTISVGLGARATLSTLLDGTDGLTKTGRGTLILDNGANTYTGTTIINEGAVVITSAGALGTDSSAVVVNGNNVRPVGGGQLVLGGGTAGMTFTRNLTLNGGGPGGDNYAVRSVGNNIISGNITAGVSSLTRIGSSFGALTLSGTVTVGSSGLTFGGPAHTIVTGQITGAGQIFKASNASGTGTLVLANASNNFTGIVNVDAGTLRIASAGALGASTAANAIEFNGGILEIRSDAASGFNGTKGVTVENNGSENSVLFVDRAIGGSGLNQTVTFKELDQNNRNFTIRGRNGYSVTFNDSTDADAYALNDITETKSFTNDTNGTVTLAGDVNINSATAKTFTIAGAGSTVITGNIIENGGVVHTLTKSGAGTLTIQGTSSTYTGATTITAGTLSIRGFGALGANPATSTTAINIGSTTSTGTLNYTGDGETTTRVISLSGTTGGAILNANQSATATVPLVLSSAFTATGAGNKTLTLGGSNTLDNEIQGAIVQNGGTTSLTKVGSGTWVLSGANSYTGTTTITDGTLKLRGAGSIASTSGLTFNATSGMEGGIGTFEYLGAAAGSSQTLGTLSLSSNAATIKVTRPGDATGATVLTLGTGTTLSRTNGATVNFVMDAGGGVNGTDVRIALSGITASGFLNPGAYFNGSNFASYNGTGATGFVEAMTYTAEQTNVLTAGAHNIIDTNAAAAAPATAVRTLKLSGNTALTLSSGTLILNQSAGSAGGILAEAGISEINGGSGISVGGSGELVVRVNGANDQLTINSALTSGTTGGFTKSGAGTLVITNPANALSGNVRIIEGTVRLANGGKLASSVLAIRNGTFDVGGVPTVTYGQLLGGGRITNSGAADSVFSFGSDNGAAIFSGIIEDGATNKLSIVKNGTGNQTMSGLSAYTGSTRINGGFILANTLGDIGTASSIGRGLATDDATNAASLVFGGGGLQYNGAASIGIDRLFTLAGNGTLDASGGNNATLIYANTGNVAFSGSGTRLLTLQGSSTGDNEIRLRLTNNTNANEALSVTKSGSGLWVLGNGNNTYTGTTTIGQGVLRAVDGQSLPSGSALVLGATTTSGVLESSGIFSRSLAATATSGSVTWGGTTGGGGFAASTGKLTVNLGGGTALTWGSGGFVPTGAPLILGSTTATFDTEFANPIDLGATTRTVQVDDNVNTLLDFATLSGVLSGAGGGLTKTGNAVLILGGANTYTGDTSINAGTLMVQSIGGSAASSSLGAASGTVNIGNTTTTGTLSYVGSGETTSRTIRLTGTTGGAIIESNGTGALVLSNIVNSGDGAKTLTLQGLNTDLNEVTANLTDSTGVSTGALSVTASQAGVWILSGNNTHSGTTTVGGQVTLGFGSDTAAGTGLIAIDNSTIFAARGDRTLANAINLRGGGRTSYFIGDYSLTFGGLAQIGTDTGDSIITNNLVAGKTLTLTGTVRNADTTASRLATFNGSGATVITGQITDGTAQTTRITYSGTGSLTLGGTGANTYTGVTTVSNGALILAKQLTPVGTGTLNLNGGALQATVDLAGTNKLANAISVGGNAAVSGGNNIEFGGTFTNSGGNRSLTNSLDGGKTLTLSGTVNLSNDVTSRTLTLAGAGNTLITGQIVNGSTSTASGLTINAPLGTVTLSNTGAANNYGGATTLSDGRLKLGAGDQIPNGTSAGNVVFNAATGATAVLDLAGFNETINGLSSSGAGASLIDNSASTGVTFTVGDNGGAGIFVGDVTKSGGGAISLNKIGMGAITFSGADLSGFSGGAIDVSAGALNLAGSAATPITPTALTVAGGATLSLDNGAGQILNLGAGLLNLGAGTGTTVLNLELGSTSAYDRIVSTGAATASNSINLNLAAITGFGAGTYNLIQAGSGLSAGSWNLNAVPGGFAYSFNTSDTLVQLIASAVTGDAYWRGDVSGSWSAIAGGGSNTNWATDATGAVDRQAGPGADATVYFSTANASGPAINTTLDTDFTINDLKFTSSPGNVTTVNISPGNPTGSLTIAPSAAATGIDVPDNVGAVTISAPLVLGANQTWNVAGTGANGSSLTVSGGLSGSGIFTKTGPGTATISAPAAAGYTATDAVVSGGNLELTHVGALGGATVSVNSGGTFYYSNATAGTLPNALNLNGGALTAGGASQTYSGNVALSEESMVKLQDLGTSTTTARTISLSGNISGPGKMLVDSIQTASGGFNQVSGVLVVSKANPDWSGGVQLQRGTIDLRDQGALGTGTLTANLGRVLFKGANGTTWNFSNPVAVDGASGNAVVELQPDNQAGTPTSVFTTNFTEAVTLGGSGAAPFLRIYQADAFSATQFSGGIVLKADASIHTSGGGTAGYQTIVIGGSGISESGGARKVTFNGDTGWNSNSYQNLRIDVSGSYTGGTTLAAGRVILGVKDALGSGALTFAGGTLQAGVDLTASGFGPVANSIVLNGTGTVDGSNSLTLSGTVTNNGGNRTLANNLTSPATLTIDGNVYLSEAAATARTLTFSGSGSTVVNGVISNADGAPGSASAIAKSGTGTVTLNAVNTYTQDTRIDQGTLAFGVNQAMTGALVFGSTNTITTAGTLDLTNADASFANLLVRTNSSTNVNTVNIGTGKTLTINGNVTIGSDAAASTTTLFSATGGGALTVNSMASGSFFNVGGTTSAAGQGNRATADLSGLSSLTVNLNTTNGVFRVNPTNSNNVGGKYSVVTLPSTGAGNTTITASQLAVGDGAQLAGLNQLNELRLGSGTNTFNVNAVNIGAGSRDYGSLTFNGASGSLVIRDVTGNGRVALNIGTGGATTGVIGDGNTFNVTGHNADLLFGAAAMGTQNRGAAHNNTFSFDQGTLDMTSLTMSTRTGDTTNGAGLARTTTSTVNLGGGTVAIQNGILTMASAAGSYGSNPAPVMNATVNVSGGTVTIGNTSGTSINMASYTATGGTGTGSSNATLNLTGGVTTITGNIVRTSASANASATVTLDGGTLDMSGKKIGGANAVALNAKSGTLLNLGELNDGGAFTKTGAGTLLLDGTNTYTGPTIVSEGTLAVGLEASVSGTTEVTVGGGLNAATLMVHGALGNNAAVTIKDQATVLGHGAINGSLTVENGGTVTPGNSVGSGVGQLIVSNGFTLQAGAHLKLEITGTNPGSGYDQLHVTSGNITLAGDLAGSSLSFTPTNFADVFYVILNNGAGTTSGTLNGVGDGDYLNIGGQDFRLSLTSDFNGGGFQIGGTGNDVALMAVPEPGSATLLAGGIGMLLGMRRFRRRV